MTTPRALVAGGAGFLGSHLHEHAGFTLVQDDAEHALDLEGPFALVLHFASPASPPNHTTHPLENSPEARSAGSRR